MTTNDYLVFCECQNCRSNLFEVGVTETTICLPHIIDVSFKDGKVELHHMDATKEQKIVLRCGKCGNVLDMTYCQLSNKYRTLYGLWELANKKNLKQE